MSEFLAGSDWASAAATFIGLIGAVVAFFHNRRKERRQNEMLTVRQSYEDFFGATEAYSAGLRVQAMDRDFSTSSHFVAYEAAKAKLAFYASRPVIERCAAYDRALRNYRNTLMKVHRTTANVEENPHGQEVRELERRRDDNWRSMQDARKVAIHAAACEVGANKPKLIDEDLVDSLFGGRGNRAE